MEGQLETSGPINVYIKQEPEEHFSLVLESFDTKKTLGGKPISEIQETIEREKTNIQVKVKSTTKSSRLNQEKFTEITKALHQMQTEAECKLKENSKMDSLSEQTESTTRNRNKRQQDKNSLTCGICGKHFKFPWKRKSHEKVHGEKVKCQICRKFFTQLSITAHLKWHELKKHEKQFECGECGRKFLTKDCLLNHEKVHNKLECDLCGWKIQSKFLMRDHLEAHQNPNAFECKVCCKRFTSTSNLSQHIRVVHSTNFDKFQCEVCQKKFANHKYLFNHKKNVHGPKKTCPVCGHQSSMNNHKKHLRSHKLNVEAETK
jgi:transcription elongation factor Elf1